MPNFSVLDRALFQFLGVISRMNFIFYGYQTHIATLSRFKLPCMISAINVTLKLARGKLSFNVNCHTKITEYLSLNIKLNIQVDKIHINPLNPFISDSADSLVA